MYEYKNLNKDRYSSNKDCKYFKYLLIVNYSIVIIRNIIWFLKSVR